MQSSKPSFMAIWLAGQFVTRCPQPCPFQQCSFPCPCCNLCVCACVFLQLSELEDASSTRVVPSCMRARPPLRLPHHTVHAISVGFGAVRVMNDLLAPWWCVWRVPWRAGHAIVRHQKVAGRPALLLICALFSPIHICLGFMPSSKAGGVFS
jgi:hypothetical protein